jgi:hypothetical protein
MTCKPCEFAMLIDFIDSYYKTDEVTEDDVGLQGAGVGGGGMGRTMR